METNLLDDGIGDTLVSVAGRSSVWVEWGLFKFV